MFIKILAIIVFLGVPIFSSADEYDRLEDILKSLKSGDKKYTFEADALIDVHQVTRLCYIKYRAARYSELDECISVSERVLKKFLAKNSQDFFSRTGLLATFWLRASVAFDFGRHSEVLVFANDFLSNIPEDHIYLNGDNGYFNIAKGTGGMSSAGIIADMMSKAIVSAGIVGDKDGVKKFEDGLLLIDKMKIGLGLFTSKLNSFVIDEAKSDPLAFIEYSRENYCGFLDIRWPRSLRDNSFPALNNETLEIRFFRKKPSELGAGGVLALSALGIVFAPLVVLTAPFNVLESVIDQRKYLADLAQASKTLMLAKSLARCGYDENALVLLQKLATHQEVAKIPGIHWQTLHELGLIFERRGDHDQAIHYQRTAAEVIEGVRKSIVTEDSKIGFSGDKQNVYRSLVALFAVKGDWQAAFEYAERAKARALVDLLSQQDKITPPPNLDEKVLALLAQADTKEAPSPILEADPQTRALAIAARQELAKKAPEIASLVSVTPVPIQDITAKLAPQETLVNYFNTGDALYALVLSGTNIKGFKLEGVGLEEEVRAFRESLEKSEPMADAQAKKLHARLIAPIADELKGKRVTFSPHAALHYLPFGALHDGKQYLVEKYSIRVMPSANALAYVKTDKPTKPGKLLALGNPDLNKQSLDLPGAQKEAVQVASIFPASKALVRKEANKEAVKELGNGFSIIHIASHGQFDAEKPLNSGLLLAGNDPDEGRLTVSDLYKMRLDTELVTLSACETGLGKVANGDDVVGLNRGFLYAGARSIVSSLWQVDDAATEKLMTTFYRNLAKKLEQREALRLAQVETKKSYPHPFYWAAFQITGAAN